MKTILVVDDEFDISEAIGAILGADGFHVDFCTNGKEAVDYFKEQTKIPCLVILDIMMPFLNGYEVLKFLKNNKRLNQIPVILMSAAHPLAKQRDFGWSDFLLKPFGLSALENAVDKHVNQE